MQQQMIFFCRQNPPVTSLKGHYQKICSLVVQVFVSVSVGGVGGGRVGIDYKSLVNDIMVQLEG